MKGNAFPTVKAAEVTSVALGLQRACAVCLKGDIELAAENIRQCGEHLTQQTELPREDIELWVAFTQHLAESWMLPSHWELAVKLLGIYPWDAPTMSSMLHALHFLPEANAWRIRCEHCRWADRFAPKALNQDTHTGDHPDRPLRIGYVSPDFRNHCVAFFFEPLLDGHDREAFTLFGYGNVAPEQSDDTTRRLAAKFDSFHDIWGQDDKSVAEQIRRDNVDILVDLAGHTHDHRLLVFARRPAPVQVTFLGYPNTTGMPQIDYRFTDSYLESAEPRDIGPELPVLLDTCFACYRPPDSDLPISDPPVKTRGTITLGSFVGAAKYNLQVLSLWAHVLHRLPEARLLLRFAGADQGVIQQQCRQAFARRNIDPARVQFDGMRPFAEHLASYREIDIALDTAPWSSHTTLCEALWMGVPVVSLAGESIASRMGCSVLSHAGLTDLIAESPTAFVNRVVELAGRPELLGDYRQGLRSRFCAGPVCHEDRFARAMESAYRTIWRRHCVG